MKIHTGACWALLEVQLGLASQAAYCRNCSACVADVARNVMEQERTAVSTVQLSYLEHLDQDACCSTALPYSENS